MVEPTGSASTPTASSTEKDVKVGKLLLTGSEHVVKELTPEGREAEVIKRLSEETMSRPTPPTPTSLLSVVVPREGSEQTWVQSEKAYLAGLRQKVAEQYLAKTDVDPGNLREFLLREIGDEGSKEEIGRCFDEAVKTKNVDALRAVLERVPEYVLVETIRKEPLNIPVRGDEFPNVSAFTEKSLRELDLYVHQPEVGFSGVVAVQDLGGSHAAIASEGIAPTAPFAIHSVGKVLTGVLALRLIQEGKITESALGEAVQLDQETLDKLPEKVRLYLQDPATRPTLGQLMHHEGGLGDYLPKYKEAIRQGQKIPGIDRPEDLLQFADETTGAPPGSYSNLGLLLVGLSLQHLTKTPFDVLLESYIKEPARMGCLSSKKPPGALFNTSDPVAEHICGSPSGGYWTTAQDLCSFGDWVSRLWRTEPGFKALIERHGGEFFEKGEIRHNGKITSASAYLSIFPQQGLTVAILSNKGNNCSEDMNSVIGSHMLRKPPPAK